MDSFRIRISGCDVFKLEGGKECGILDLYQEGLLTLRPSSVAG
jgi:hypothetical protein